MMYLIGTRDRPVNKLKSLLSYNLYFIAKKVDNKESKVE